MKLKADLRALFPLAALALFLRAFLLGKQSVSTDEAFTIWVGTHPLKEIVQILHFDAHPPFYYFFIHFVSLFGQSAAYLRFYSVLFGIGNMIIIFLLAKKLADAKTALLSALFWSCAFFAFDYETWIRMYAPALFFSLLSTWMFWRAVNDEEWKQWIAYILSGVLALYIHYFTGFVLLAHGLYLILRRRFKTAVWLAPVGAFLFLPWISVFFFQVANGVSEPMGGANWSEFIFTPAVMFFTEHYFHGLLFYVFVTVFVLGVCGIGSFQLIKNQPQTALFLGLLVLAPWIASYAITELSSRHVYVMRYMLFFAPYLFILFFNGVRRFPNFVKFPILAAMIFVNLTVWFIFLTSPPFERQNWRRAAQIISESMKPKDTFFVELAPAVFPLWYYLPNDLQIEWRNPYYAVKGRNTHWYTVEGSNSIPLMENAAKISNRFWLVMCWEKSVDPGRAVLRRLTAHQKFLASYRIRSFEPQSDIYLFSFESK